MIHVLIGTRAQLIKMIPLMHLMQEEGIPYNFIYMAQHHETIYQMIDDFAIKRPDHVLCDRGTDIVSSKQMVLWSLKVLMSGYRRKNEIFEGDRNGIVLIHGDAPPLLLGALLAKGQGLAVASVEAGLRSFNYFKPFPEELTRVLTGKLGLIDLFFCQDEAATENASRYRGTAINTHGNTIIDSIRLATEINAQDTGPHASKPYAVVTLHRFETISNRDRLDAMVSKVIRIAGHTPVKFILHPPTRSALKKSGLYARLEAVAEIELLPRMSFLDFNRCITNAEFIVTDGGSNQEESAFLGIPCLLFRSETERADGLDANVVLSRFDDQIIDDFLNNYRALRRPRDTRHHSPSRRILDELLSRQGVTRAS